MKEYYIQNSCEYVGNNLSFWAKGDGYTCHVRDARLFSREEADKIHADRRTDVPIHRKYVERAATLQVDVQRLRVEE